MHAKFNMALAGRAEASRNSDSDSDKLEHRHLQNSSSWTCLSVFRVQAYKPDLLLQYTKTSNIHVLLSIKYCVCHVHVSNTNTRSYTVTDTNTAGGAVLSETILVVLIIVEN